MLTIGGRGKGEGRCLHFLKLLKSYRKDKKVTNNNAIKVLKQTSPILINLWNSAQVQSIMEDSWQQEEANED